MAKEFNYRDYLKNNPLLNEAEENKDIEEEVKKSSKKTTIKELKASIRERILAEMEEDLDESSAVNWRDRNSPAGDSLDLSPRKVGTSTVEEELEDMDEAEEVDVEDNEDINIDIEDEINIDDESSKSEIEVDSELAGEDSDVAAILGLLTKAQSEAEALGDEKLMDQIGNTITYYTRAHVVKGN